MPPTLKGLGAAESKRELALQKNTHRQASSVRPEQASSIHGAESGWCTASRCALPEMCLLFFFADEWLYKPEGLFKYALWVSLERDRIIKQFWIEKKSTPGKKQNKKQRIFFDAHSELNRKWIAVQRISSATVISVMLEALTPHLLRVVGTTHCKEQRGNGVSIHRAVQAASLRDQADKKKKRGLFMHCWLQSKPHREGCLATAHRRLQRKQSSFK